MYPSNVHQQLLSTQYRRFCPVVRALCTMLNAESRALKTIRKSTPLLLRVSIGASVVLRFPALPSHSPGEAEDVLQDHVHTFATYIPTKT